jgi:error-prone DNA polymerase
LFVTLEDETGSANLIVWPKIFERFRPETLAAKLMSVRGRLQREAGVIHIIVEHVHNLNHRLAELSDGSLSLPSEPPCVDVSVPKSIAYLPATNPLTRAFSNSRDFH